MEEQRVLEEVQLAAQEVAIRMLLEQAVGYNVSRWSSSRGIPLTELLENQSALAELYAKYEDETNRKNKSKSKTKSKNGAGQGSSKKIFSPKRSATEVEHEEDEDDEISVSDLSEALEDLIEPKKKSRLRGKHRGKNKTITRQRANSLSEISDEEFDYDTDSYNDQSANAEESSCDDAYTTEDDSSMHDSVSISEVYTVKKSKRKFFAKAEEGLSANLRDNGKLTKKLNEDDILRAEKANMATEILSRLDNTELSLLMLMELLIRPNNNPIFTLNLVQQPIDKLAAEKFLDIKISTIQAWLKSLNPMIKIFYRGDAEKLVFKFESMKTKLESLNNNPDMTYLELMEPDLVAELKARFEVAKVDVRYKSVFQNLASNPDQYVEQYLVVPVNEFETEMEDQQYRIVPNGCDHVVLNHSGGMFDVVRPNVFDPKSSKFMLTSTEMLEEFEKALVEWEKINQINVEFRNNNTTPFFELKSEKSKEIAVNRLNLKTEIDETFKNALMNVLRSGQFSPSTLELQHLSVPSLALHTALSYCGVRVARLDLSYNTAVDDKTLRVISDHCANLVALTMHSVAISKINNKLPKLRSLDMSLCPSFEDNIFKDIKKYCQALDTLILSGTHVSAVTADLNVTHLDISKCSNITDDIFTQLKKYCKKLISLSLKGTSITSVDLDALELSHLDVSNCGDITQLSTKKQRNNALMAQSKLGLVSLKANNCGLLESILISDTSRLFSLSANNCKNLSSVRLAPRRSSPALEVIDLDQDTSLETLEVRPYNLKILNCLNCFHIMAPLSHQLLELLFTQMVSKVMAPTTQMRSAFAAGLLSRNLGSEFPYFLKTKHAEKVFCGKNLSGMDASSGNWDEINLSGANLQNTRWNNAYINGAIFANARMDGAFFGQKPAYEDHDDAVCCIEYSPNGLLMATGYRDGVVIIRNHSEVVHTLKVTGYANSVSFSHDGKLLAVGGAIINREDSEGLSFEDYGNDFCVVVFNLCHKDTDPSCFKTHLKEINAVAFSPCGNFLATASVDTSVKIRNLKNNEIQRHMLHKSSVSSLSWCPQGRYLASGGYDKNIIIWDTEEEIDVAVMGGDKYSGHDKQINDLAYSRNGKFIVSNSDDKTVKVWGAREYKCLKTLDGHRRNPECVAISPDSKLIASGESLHKNCKVIIWDAESGKVTQELGHHGGVSTLAFKPDLERPKQGWLLVTGSGETIRRWVIDSDLVPQGLLRKEQYSVLDAAMADISNVVGLTEENAELLHQLNAYGKTM